MKAWVTSLLSCTIAAFGATEDIVIADFDTPKLDGWIIKGEAFGPGPVKGNVGRQRPFRGKVGTHLLNSFHGDDKAKGTVTSPEFVINRQTMTFRLGGGNHKGKTCANLLINGKVVRSATGPGHNEMVDRHWNVGEFKGQTARLEIVDDHSGGWGFVAADHFVLTDKPVAKKNPAKKKPAKKKGTPEASGSREAFLETVKMPDGMSIELYSDQVKAPTTLDIDDHNNVYVAEAIRWRRGVEDNRNHRYWLMDDIASQVVADRQRMYEKWSDTKKPMSYFTDHGEAVKKLRDTNGDGKADQAHTFADGWNAAIDGQSGGLLVHDGTVYFANIPSIYKLTDANNDHQAENREKWLDGFGVRVSISGHDLNAPVMGPDGKLYFSIGDRGFDLKTADGKRIHSPDTGAVFRCYPDGSELEQFFFTLRNPKEIAFDQYGRLFSVDNDCNIDQSRLVYLLEGGEAGWHSGHQMTQDFGNEVDIGLKRPCTWFVEGLWKTRFDGQPQYILPPVDYITAGPCGFVFNPGATALPKSFANAFFVADYRSSSNKSGFHTFKVESAGAGLKMTDAGHFIWGMCATDMAFGPDGKAYLTDFVGGWGAQDKGYVYTAFDKSRLNAPDVTAAGKALKANVKKLTADAVYSYLFSPDLRVRQRGQFELARRGEAGRQLLRKAIAQQSNELARLHGVWGLGQQLRTNKALASHLIALLPDTNAHVRAQAAKILGDHRIAEAVRPLIAALSDQDLHVRAMAAIALGKLGDRAAAQPLLQMLATNNNGDANLRHAGVMGLASASTDWLTSQIASANAAQRLAILLALRKRLAPEIAQFLTDAEPTIVEEAIRVIHDENIVGALPAVAELLPNAPDGLSTIQVFRLLNSNLRSGRPADLERLFAFAVDAENSDVTRQEAMTMIEKWAVPHPVCRVICRYRPLPPRQLAPVQGILEAGIQRLQKNPSDKIRGAATKLAGIYDIKVSADALLSQITNRDGDPSARIEALRSIAQSNPEKAAPLAQRLLTDATAQVRHQALAVLAQIDGSTGFAAAETALQSKDLRDRQNAWAVLGRVPGPAAAKKLTNAVHDVRTGTAPDNVALDVLLAAEQRSEPTVKSALEAYNKSLPKSDPLAAWRVSRHGGDPINGKQLFNSHGSAQCLVCHKMYGVGGEVGPVLDAIGANSDIDHIWESIVAPNNAISSGFGIISITKKDNTVLTGTFLSSTDKGVSMRLPDGKQVDIPRGQIATETRPLSGMPNMTQVLKPAEVRDIVAFLAAAKEKPKASTKH